MTGGQLSANVDQYLQAATMNAPPPQIVSDPLVTGATPIEQLLRVLGLAANLGDPQDNADSTAEHAKRDAKTNEAAEKFAAQDEDAAQELNNVADQADPLATQVESPKADQTAAMTQQLPQAASSIAGALSGALGGALQPLAQIPRRVAQGAQQAMQSGMGLFQQAAAPVEDAGLDSAPFDEIISTPEDLASLGDGGGGDGLGGIGGGAGLGSADLGGGNGGGVGGGLLGGAANLDAGTATGSLSPARRRRRPRCHLPDHPAKRATRYAAGQPGHGRYADGSARCDGRRERLREGRQSRHPTSLRAHGAATARQFRAV